MSEYHTTHNHETPQNRRWWENQNETEIARREYNFKKDFGTKKNLQEAMLNDIKSLLASVNVEGVESIECGERLFMNRDNHYYERFTNDEWQENASGVLTVVLSDQHTAYIPLPDVVEISPVFGDSHYEPETLTMTVNTALIKKRAEMYRQAFGDADRRSENYWLESDYRLTRTSDFDISEAQYNWTPYGMENPGDEPKGVWAFVVRKDDIPQLEEYGNALRATMHVVENVSGKLPVFAIRFHELDDKVVIDYREEITLQPLIPDEHRLRFTTRKTYNRFDPDDGLTWDTLDIEGGARNAWAVWIPYEDTRV